MKTTQEITENLLEQIEVLASYVAMGGDNKEYEESARRTVVNCIEMLKSQAYLDGYVACVGALDTRRAEPADVEAWERM